MTFTIERDGASLVRVRYKNFNDIRTCKKYFYKYIDVMGRALPNASKESLVPFVRGFFKAATGQVLDSENLEQEAVRYFFEAIVAADRVFQQEDEPRIQEIYKVLVRQLFSGEYKLRKVQ